MAISSASIGDWAVIFIRLELKCTTPPRQEIHTLRHGHCFVRVTGAVRGIAESDELGVAVMPVQNGQIRRAAQTAQTVLHALHVDNGKFEHKIGPLVKQRR